MKDKLEKLQTKLCTTEEAAKKELEEILKNIYVDEAAELFDYEKCIVIEVKETKRTEKRNGKARAGSYSVKKYRGKIINVSEKKEKINLMKHKLGWRLYVTNAEKKCLTFSSAYRYFRKTMYVIEIGFHVLKDYLNISPLFVRNQDQIIGMTRLLILALKILTLMTAEVRANMKKEGIVLKGLYAGQPARKHSSPTSQSLLEYFSRQNMALVGYRIGELWKWQLNPLTDTCRMILKLLKIPESIYEGLPEKLMLMG